MRPAGPFVDPGQVVDLDRVAEELDYALRSTVPRVRIAGRDVQIKLGWELFDDPRAPGKLLVVRWTDPGAADGSRLAGKLTAALRVQASGGVFLDCTSPFHGVSLRPAYHRQGLVGDLMRQSILPCLPRPRGIVAAVGPGTAAGVALEFWRSYMDQRRGPDWLESIEGRIWWTTLPENRELDWEAAGGYPAIFSLLRASGLDQRLREPAQLLGTTGIDNLEAGSRGFHPEGGVPT